MEKRMIKGVNTTLAQQIVDCNDTVMTLDDAAVFLGKSREAVKKMCQRNQIPAHKERKSWFLLKSEVVNWLRSL
ncbi:MAG: helix-turn-helix domain-containing protein [Bacteroidaceae bacterium]|nr:helix-turn-helix domain-containing protein [Bacteroidaceae bacterium]